MSASNLPPGVTASMIDDSRWERLCDHIIDTFAASGLGEDEIERAIAIGIAAVNAERAIVGRMLKDVRLDAELEHAESKL